MLLYAMLKAALVTAVLMTVVCWAFGWRKIRIAAPVQFATVLAATYVVGPETVRVEFADDAIWMALVLSALTTSVYVALRLMIRVLARRDPLQDAQERAQQRY